MGSMYDIEVLRRRPLLVGVVGGGSREEKI